MLTRVVIGADYPNAVLKNGNAGGLALRSVVVLGCG